MVRAVAWLLVLAPAAALAQPSAQDARITAAARALFQEGIAFGDAGDWSSALDRFERALALRDSPVVRFNLAQSCTHLGRLVEGSEHAVRVAQHPQADAGVRQAAEELRAWIAARLARLTVRLGEVPDDASATLDGRAIPASLVGVAMPVDPGPHEVTLVVGGRAVASEELVLAEGETRELTLDRPPEPPTPAPPAALVAEPPTTPEPSPTPHRRRRWLATTGALVAAGVVAVVLAVTLGGGEDPTRGDFDPDPVRVR